MSKKCLRCGAPLDGFFAKVATLAGVKPSEKNPDYCNKCEAFIPVGDNDSNVVKAEEPKIEPVATEAPSPVEPNVAPEAPTASAEDPKPPEAELKLNTEEPKDIFADTDKTV